MQNFRELANEFRGTDFEFTKDNRKAYSKAIKALVSMVNGNEELSNIAKSFMYTVARVIGTDSNELGEADRNVMARFLETTATFVENPNPRYIKVSWADYYRIARDSKFEELVYGTWFKMVRLKDGEIVIYEMEDTVPNEWTQKMLFGEVVR